MALALDEPTDQDEVTDVDGYSVVVEKGLLEQAKPITIDLTYAGFEVHSSMQLGGGSSCSSCGTAGSCCS